MKINLGCGYDIKGNYMNIDKYKIKGAVQMDVNILPLKIISDSAELILAYNFIEHIKEPDNLIKECHRILKKGGILDIIVPHCSNGYCHHQLHLTYYNSFAFEVYTHTIERHTAEEMNLFSVEYLKICFYKGFQLWNYPIEWLVNLNKYTRAIYERQLCWIFPSNEIRIKLKKR